MAQIFVFDAYGTLFDVHSAVARHAAAVGPSATRLSEVWRAKQLEYSWVRTLAGRYRDFWSITEDALDFALAAVKDANPDARALLLDAYRTLDCYAEVPQALAALKQRGAATAVFSNGSPAMLDAAIASAGLGALLDRVISVDPLRKFKTAPETYALVTTAFGCEPGEIAFHSSNRWDIAGAAAFGFECAWVNRAGQPEEYPDLPPVRVLRDLRSLI